MKLDINLSSQITISTLGKFRNLLIKRTLSERTQFHQVFQASAKIRCIRTHDVLAYPGDWFHSSIGSLQQSFKVNEVKAIKDHEYYLEIALNLIESSFARAFLVQRHHFVRQTPSKCR